jgi:Na+/alanine symporter
MKSLAILVVVLLLIVMLSGPLAIILTSRKVRAKTHGRAFPTLVRRLLALAIGFIGGFISLQLIWSDAALPPKLLAIVTLSELVYAFRVEWRAAHLF